MAAAWVVFDWTVPHMAKATQPTGIDCGDRIPPSRADDQLLLADGVLKAALDCIVAVDGQGRIIEFNPAAERTFGWSREEAIGQPMDEMIIPDVHRAAHRHGMERYLAGGAARVLGRRLELEARRRDGSIFPVELSITEVDHGGAPLFVAYLRDLTERNAATAKLDEARALLQAFMDHIPTSIYLKRADHTVLHVSKHLAQQYGKSVDDMVGRFEYDLHVPEMQVHLEAMDAHILGTGESILMEGYHSGFERHELVSRFPIFDESGDITHIGGMNFDIDDRTKAQAELAEAQARFEAFFNNAPAAMYVRDLENRVVMVNQWGARMYGRTPEEMIGLPVTLARSADDADRFKRVDAELHRTGQPQTDEFEYPLHGETATAKCTIFPIMNQQGEIFQVGALIFDITEERRAQAQLAASQNSLHQSEKLAALGQLLAGVAHELNNPLAIVLGRAAILKDKLAGTPHVESIQKLRDAADRCARIVKTFLAMARQTGPRRSTAQINELIEGALDMTAYGLRNAEIDLVLDLDPALPSIEVDEDQIVQLLINLIVNAQHALEEKVGDRRLTVRTMFDSQLQQATIEISDDGPGVPDNVAARIFDPFFTTKGVGEGTGLGLSVCKGMVEAHGGKLTVGTTPGGGATFRAILPVLDTGTAILEAHESAREPAQGHILIVDDEPEIAAILADCLMPLGVSCDIASDGATALERIASSRFDAIFCDVRMPGMDGIALYAKIKAEHPDLARRLAFVSGDVLHRDLARLKAVSDRPIIEKPFDPQLVRDIAMLLLAPAGDKS